MSEHDRPVKSPPRRTRREAPQPPAASTSNSDAAKKASAPPTSRRTGVWGDTIFSTAKETQSNTKLSPDTDEDIPVIPDLDELQEEEMASQVAQAPNVAVTRVATYKELDSDLFQHAAFANVDDVSLRLLTMRLHPEADIVEPDVVWTWDALFSEVMSQLPEQSSPVHANKEEDLKHSG